LNRLAIRTRSIVIALAVAFAAALGFGTAQLTTGSKARAPGLYAAFETSMGTFVVQLYERKAPKTVENFVGLAKGTIPWVDPKSGEKVQLPFYDGLLFFHITPNLAVRTGCPANDGTGGPGYTIPDENSTDTAFDRPGRVAMYAAKPNEAGSQIMIILRPAPFMNGKFTIFGQVVDGLDVVARIARVPTDDAGRPTQEIKIRKVTIDRVK
jgi:peptidyl-prolyl cis-trans isomerase A (cyclophilin A)